MEHTARERFHAVMGGDLSKGLPILEWASWWDLTLAAWRDQGLPGDADPAQWFDLHRHHQIWISPRGNGCPGPSGHGAGIVGSEEDYDRILPYLYPAFDRDPLDMERIAKAQAGGDLAWLTLEGPFWFPRTLFGIEGHLFAFYDHGDLMKRMNGDLADHCIAMIDAVCKYYTPDFMTFAEDMSYNHGPMISYPLMDAFMKPFYERVIPEVRKRGIIPIIDSDGDIEPLIPWFQGVGLDGILPLERMAGVDVSRIRSDHPEWRMIGGFDKTIMHLGEDALRAEFARIKPAVLGGKYIPSCDHQTPPAVSVEDYRLYIRIFKEFSEEIARESGA